MSSCLCEGTAPITGLFHTQRSNNAKSIFIQWRHHETNLKWLKSYLSRCSESGALTWSLSITPELNSRMYRWKWEWPYCKTSKMHVLQIFAFSSNIAWEMLLISSFGIMLRYFQIVTKIWFEHGCHQYSTRADFRFAPSQWETSLQSNTVSHWLGANLESALNVIKCHVSYSRPQGRTQMVGIVLRKLHISSSKSETLSCGSVCYCRQTSNIRRTKLRNLNVSRLVLQLSLSNPLKPGFKSRMKM